MQKDITLETGEIITVEDTGKLYRNGVEIKQSQMPNNGYMYIHSRQQTYWVHRIVASAFIQPIKRGDRSIQVHHINEIKSDNRVENLTVVSVQEHMREHKQIYPTTKRCVVCGAEFTPHKTKRKRQQTCSEKCKLALMKKRMEYKEKPIAQYDLDGNLIKVWKSGRDICRETGFFDSNINKCVHGKSKTYKGYVWKYADSGNKS